jgi:hypothetical protein
MGIRALMGSIMLIAFSILLLVPAGAQSAFAGLSEAPTCTAGFLYNTSTDMCEKTTTVAPTCPAGAPLNTSSDLCEGIITPTCLNGILNPSGDSCSPTCDPISDQFCSPLPKPPHCAPGNFNTASNQCELNGSLLENVCVSGDPLSNDMCLDLCFSVGCTITLYSPICDPGLRYNPDSDLCDIAIFSPTCTIGNYNMVSNQCEATTTSTPTCPDGFTLNTFTDLCESPFEEDPGVPIGGTLIPIDSASLFLVGAQMTTSWLIPVIVSAVGIVLVFVRKSENS